MKIFVSAKPKAKKEFIKKIDDSHFTVSVKELPIRGLANKAIIRILAEYFCVPPSGIFLRSGFSSRQKIFEIKQ